MRIKLILNIKNKKFRGQLDNDTWRERRKVGIKLIFSKNKNFGASYIVAPSIFNCLTGNLFNVTKYKMMPPNRLPF